MTELRNLWDFGNFTHLSQGSHTAILSGGLHSLDSIFFSEEEVQAERGHGCGPAHAAAITQSGALSRRLGLQQPGRATWPDPQRESPLVGGWGVQSKPRPLPSSTQAAAFSCISLFWGHVLHTFHRTRGKPI